MSKRRTEEVFGMPGFAASSGPPLEIDLEENARAIREAVEVVIAAWQRLMRDSTPTYAEHRLIEQGRLMGWPEQRYPLQPRHFMPWWRNEQFKAWPRPVVRAEDGDPLG